MSWGKIDDQLHGHPKAMKVWDADRGALGLHLLAISYCAAYLTDGHVADEFVTSKLPDRHERKRTTDALVACALWAREKAGWRINDWLEYNPSRAAELERKRKDAERKTRGRTSNVRKESERNPNGIHAPPGRTDSVRPVPTRPFRGTTQALKATPRLRSLPILAEGSTCARPRSAAS